MKKIFLIMIAFFTAAGFAQFKDPGFPTSNVKDGIITQPSSSLFGFLNSENFSMHHSYSLSYSSFGSNGLALGVYTNSMNFNFSNNLDVQVDASLVHSPYSSFGNDAQNNINGIYLSRAALNYRPWDDVYISVQYRQLPAYASPYGSYYGGYSMFDRFGGGN
ncbi:MAG: hypothetical protein K8H86_10635 [Ignavibacteriaceae bacterium]|nr:hypothetical protein [Ignavibacteriaceae bacterium]